MPDQLLFAIEVTLNGLMTGVLYSLVALGFVLIFKASGIFNYAQGVMALFAALTLVGIMEGRVQICSEIADALSAELGASRQFWSERYNQFVADKARITNSAPTQLINRNISSCGQPRYRIARWRSPVWFKH